MFCSGQIKSIAKKSEYFTENFCLAMHLKFCHFWQYNTLYTVLHSVWPKSFIYHYFHSCDNGGGGDGVVMVVVAKVVKVVFVVVLVVVA